MSECTASNSVSEYIRQVIPRPYFSPTQTRKMIVHPTTGNLFFQAEYMGVGARLIHFHSLVLCFTKGAILAGTTTLRDSLSNVYIDVFPDTSLNGLYQLDMVINSGLIKLEWLNSAGIVANMSVTVQYQYISDKPFKKDA